MAIIVVGSSVGGANAQSSAPLGVIEAGSAFWCPSLLPREVVTQVTSSGADQ